MLKEFLNDVVAEYIGHQLDGIRMQLSKDLVFLIAIGGLKLLLDKT